MTMAADRVVCQAGETEVFERWFRQYYRDVLHFVLLRVGDADDACDITQECFLKAYRARHRFRGDCAPRTWLIRIAINACRDHLRQRRRARAVFVEAEPEEETLSTVATWPGPDPDALDVQRCLPLLDDELQSALTLKYVHGLSFRELGQAMGCGQSVALSRVRRAQRAMRRLMSLGGSCAPSFARSASRV